MPNAFEGYAYLDIHLQYALGPDLKERITGICLVLTDSDSDWLEQFSVVDNMDEIQKMFHQNKLRPSEENALWARVLEATSKFANYFIIHSSMIVELSR